MRWFYLPILFASFGCGQSTGADASPDVIDASITDGRPDAESGPGDPDADIPLACFDAASLFDGGGCGGSWPFEPANACPAVPTIDLVIDTIDGVNTDSCEENGFCVINGLSVPARIIPARGPGDQSKIVIDLQSLTITPSGLLLIQGWLPTIFLVHGAVDIRGTVERSPSTGGASAVACCLSDGQFPVGSSGGGGGGFGGRGGDGGSSGGSGGAASTDVWHDPLRGGCHGHTHQDSTRHGGGALQISALMSVDVSGTIRAVGRGGRGGYTFNGPSGAGGGSGGAIVIEAPDVNVSGVLCATGGSGGEGGDDLMPGAEGRQGRCDGMAALTEDDLASGGNGGAGATLANPDGSPGLPGIGDAGGGGGGGGLGRVRIRTTNLMQTGSIYAVEDDVAL